MVASLSEHTAFIAFAAASVVAFGIQAFWLWKVKSAPLSRLVWALAVLVLVVTWQLAGQAGEREKVRIQKRTQDFARLYGREMEVRGHWRLASDAGADDPLYLDLIETEKRWLALSPSVNDIYTFRKRPDGKNVLIVDSETDYDRNGKFEGEREQRTAISEIYEVADPGLERAFAGEVAFTAEPMTDRWGTWISGFVPLRTPDGAVEGVLGVDFEAKVSAEAVADARSRVISLMAVVQVVLLGASTLVSIILAAAGERLRAHARLRESERFARSTVEALSAHIAILDEKGIIIAVNERWRAFAAANQPVAGKVGVGADYLAACDAARGDRDAAAMGAGIRSLLAGESTEFAIEYPCHAPTEDRWFIGRVTTFAGDGPRRLVVAHENITVRKAAEQAVREAGQKLAALSREAGMAEVATSVLHNVGNVLNSANVSLEMAAGKVRGLKAGSLERLTALLHEHAGDLPAFFATHPQGTKIPAFLTKLSTHFTSEQAAVLAELDSLRGNIEHINEIVAMQQGYASCGGVVETIQVAELIETALRMNEESLAKHAVTLVREFADVPGVSVDKHKLMQILVNLIRNGKQSCDQADPPEKRLTLRVANGGGSVKISVSDNGVGIPQENLDRIFSHGFTTKKTGHGFGLHSAANAAGEMGGRLRVESAGAGLGATFTIELPVGTHGNPTQTEANPGV